MNLYGLVGNNAIGHYDVLGMAWDDPPALPQKELDLGCCICVVAPSLCYIDIDWTGELNDVQKYTTAGGQQRDKAYFGAAAFVELKHFLGFSVVGCHLHQAATQYFTTPYSAPPLVNHNPNDFGLGIKPPSYPYYGGTWLWDPPVTKVQAEAGQMANPHTAYFAAHVYVEEEPSVEAFWGYSGKVTAWNPVSSTYTRYTLGSGWSSGP